MNRTTSQKKRKSVSSTTSRYFASTAILLTVLIQTHAAITRMGCKVISVPVICSFPDDPRSYPFLNYPMYSQTHYEGDIIYQYPLTVTFEDSSQGELTATDLQITDYEFNRKLLPAIAKQDYSNVGEYIRKYEQQHKKVMSIRLEESPKFMITKNGLEEFYSNERKVVSDMQIVSINEE